MKNMKLRLLCLAALILCVILAAAACTADQGTETTAGADSVTEAPSEEASSAEETTEEETTRRELTWETYDPALDDSAVDQSATHTVDQSQWIVQDGLDRIVSTNIREIWIVRWIIIREILWVLRVHHDELVRYQSWLTWHQFFKSLTFDSEPIVEHSEQFVWYNQIASPSVGRR